MFRMIQRKLCEDQKASPVGLEPTASGLEVQRAIHCATETHRYLCSAWRGPEHTHKLYDIFVNSNNIPVEKVPSSQSFHCQYVKAVGERLSHEFSYPSFLQNGVLRKLFVKDIEKKKVLPRRGIEPRPRRWERRILTTRPPGRDVCKGFKSETNN